MFKVNYPNKVFKTKAMAKIEKEVKRLLETPGAILAIIGEIGAGKTIATFEALSEYEETGHYIIWIKNPERERLRAGSIIASIIRNLGEEPRRDAESRSEQLRRLMGEKSATRRICIVLDDAHVAPPSLLRSFKRLLELGFGRRFGLCSLLLIGTPELYAKLTVVPEIFWRTKKIDMNLLTAEEAKNFTKWGASWENIKLEESAAEYIGSKFNNPLIITSVLSMLEETAARIGESKITLEMVKAILGREVRQQMMLYDISQKELAEKIGCSPSQVSKVLSGSYPGDRTAQVIENLNKLIANKTGIK
uniref:Helix-turn-helix domain-containing protein n=1 Tax=candidate division WOR-3 bacterium TaxID=2052148 RepID=A0A7C6A7V5_UNCW3